MSPVRAEGRMPYHQTLTPDDYLALARSLRRQFGQCPCADALERDAEALAKMAPAVEKKR